MIDRAGKVLQTELGDTQVILRKCRLGQTCDRPLEPRDCGVIAKASSRREAKQMQRARILRLMGDHELERRQNDLVSFEREGRDAEVVVERDVGRIERRGAAERIERGGGAIRTSGGETE